MVGKLSKNWQGRYSLPDGTCFTAGDIIEIIMGVRHWFKAEVHHNHKDYYLKEFPQLKIEGLIARIP